MRVLIAATILLAPACAGPATFDVRRASEAELLELSLSKSGAVTTIEYHVDTAEVPPAVKQSMDRLHPGGPFTGAEYEVLESGEGLWELSRVVDGRKVEALFHADGRLHSEELEIDGSTVPDPVRSRLRERFPRGSGWSFEEIRNEQQRPVEFHVKLEQDGMRYKAAVYQNGHIRAIWREVQAEVEVPVR